MPLTEDDLVCYCFHVPLRKVEGFCRKDKPVYASQISQCLSAGTGCGWCIPMLKKIHREIGGQPEPWWRQSPDSPAEPTSADQYESSEAYALARQQYLASRKQPPSKH